MAKRKEPSTPFSEPHYVSFVTELKEKHFFLHHFFEVEENFTFSSLSERYNRLKSKYSSPPYDSGKFKMFVPIVDELFNNYKKIYQRDDLSEDEKVAKLQDIKKRPLMEYIIKVVYDDREQKWPTEQIVPSGTTKESLMTSLVLDRDAFTIHYDGVIAPWTTINVISKAAYQRTLSVLQNSVENCRRHLAFYRTQNKPLHFLVCKDFLVNEKQNLIDCRRDNMYRRSVRGEEVIKWDTYCGNVHRDPLKTDNVQELKSDNAHLYTYHKRLAAAIMENWWRFKDSDTISYVIPSLGEYWLKCPVELQLLVSYGVQYLWQDDSDDNKKMLVLSATYLVDAAMYNLRAWKEESVNRARVMYLGNPWEANFLDKTERVAYNNLCTYRGFNEVEKFLSQGGRIQSIQNKLYEIKFNFAKMRRAHTGGAVGGN